LNFVDGGLFDNLGALAVLRRGVDTILICAATDGDVDAEDSAATFKDIAALFGLGEPLAPDWIAKDGYKNYINKRGKVFDEKEFELLIEDMKKLKEKGKPLVRHKKLMVRENGFAGIHEDREVDVIFCFNGPCDEFDRLSKREKDNGWWPFQRAFPYKKSDFPFFDTSQCDYSVKEVNTLSSICSYTLVDGLKNLDKFDIDKPAKAFEEGWEKKCAMFYEE
jgi:hypothetical protein